LLSICSENNIEGSLKFERAPIKLQRVTKSTKIRREEREGKWRSGGIGSLWKYFKKIIRGCPVFWGQKLQQTRKKISWLGQPRIFFDL
jgi:hypothetical protein